MIDYFHLEKYGVTAVNYNRDLEVFPVLKDILFKIVGKDIYYSPTDMGVNVIKDCITDENGVIEASKNEIIRRYYKALVDQKKGIVSYEVVERIKCLMNELNIVETDRKVVEKALEKKKKSNCHSACIEIGKKYITGRQTTLLSPISSVIINAIKYLTHIPDDVDILSPSILEPILKMKDKTLNFKESTLSLNEVLLALSICSATNPIVGEALDKLSELNHTQLHATYIIPDSEAIILNNLGINATCEVEANLSN